MPVDQEVAADSPRLGADSLVWKFYGDIRGVLGFQRLAGTENCVEQLGKAVEDHSVIFSDTVGRARRSGPPIMRTVYSADPHRWGRIVRDFHRPIKGEIADGSRYHALNPELFYWAHATFVDQVIYVTDTFIRRLSEQEKEQIFDESRIWYRLYGVSDRGQPQTYAQFREYWHAMLDRFVPTKTIRYATGYLRGGLPAPRWAPASVWNVIAAPLNALLAVIVVGTLPPQMRAVCSLEWDANKEKRFQRFAAVMRALNPVFNRLPVRLLYLPWAAEAWRRVGVDPRRIHNGPPLVRSVLARPPAGSALRPVFGTGLPGAVEVLRTVRDPLRVLNERRARFGDISYSNMFGIKVVFPLSPGGIEEVAMNRNKAFAAGPSWGYMIGPFFRRGILLMDFDEHRYHRRILQQAFTTPHLKGYLREMQPLIRERVARFPVGDGVRMLPELKKLTLDVALEVFLGLELPQAQADRINKAFIACVDAGMSLIRRDVPGTKWSRGLAGRKVLEEFMYQHLPAKRAAAAPDLFSALCRVRSDEGHAFTDEDVVNHMIFVLMAAHDTSTITLATMAYQLARHPEWQDRARTESQSFAADLDYDALGELTVLDAVMKESLRLNAPVPGLARQAVEDTEVDGYFVPKGAHVFAVPMVNHHDPRLWTDPERFDPARFGPERAEDKSHRFAWMPFGGRCAQVHRAVLCPVGGQDDHAQPAAPIRVVGAGGLHLDPGQQHPAGAQGPAAGAAAVAVVTAAEQRLLDAARGEFERYGVRRTTMDDIARRAGVSRSTLYRRYPTKDALFEQLALVDSAELFGQLDQLAKGRDPQSAVIDCFTAGVRLVHEMPLARAILESEPELLVGLATRTKSLPILQAAERVAGSLRRSGVTMPDDDLRAVSEILVRLTMSLLLNPGGQLELSDSAAVRRYAERYLARMVW